MAVQSPVCTGTDQEKLPTSILSDLTRHEHSGPAHVSCFDRGGLAKAGVGEMSLADGYVR